ncbi:MAG: acetyl-CoA carboxylase biotin carboxyl carrier protein [Candidatus Muirbacterium halophilum]|nr:acetyl-CoA carboxylase biotin carboxyl carrier protein [Candidatus Muirbacterium halophilum]MCK9474693.1 acetyl-CoA carboxylase biotin carboxyl carrier protein [Candidatus Muirbacterium halophilum]
MKELKDISKIFELFDKYELSEFSFKDGDLEISLSKENVEQQIFVEKPKIKIKEDFILSESKPVKKSEDNKKDFKEVKSPINGNFYRSPSPNAKSFVEVGEIIKQGQVVCIIESMKLMNEIKSDFSGKIADITIDNGQPVTKGQVLFLID